MRPRAPTAAHAAKDFVNSLNNTVSGAIALASGHKDGDDSVDVACLANAWIGQF